MTRREQRPPVAGRFILGQPIRKSHDAIAWLAHDSRSGQTVVVLLVPQRGAQALAKLAALPHPNLARILDVLFDVAPEQLPVRVKGSFGVAVLEHIPGESLAERLRQGPMRTSEAARIIAPIASALATMHHAGLHHGAVSCASITLPANAERGPVLTWLAPPDGAYCSPERAASHRSSPFDDTWALHATFFTTITGDPPFEGSTLDELQASIRAGNLRNVTELEPSVRLLFERGFLVEPQRRQSDANAVERALARLSRKQEGGRVSLPERFAQGRRSALFHSSVALTAREEAEGSTTGPLRTPRCAWRPGRGRPRLRRISGLRPALRHEGRAPDIPAAQPPALEPPALEPPALEPPAPQPPAESVTAVAEHTGAPSSFDIADRAPNGRRRIAVVGAMASVSLVATLLVITAGLHGGWIPRPDWLASEPPLPPSSVVSSPGESPTGAQPSSPKLGAASVIPPSPVPIASATVAHTSPAASSAGPTIVAKAPSSQPGPDVQACVASFFGSGSFVDGHDEDLSFLCEDRDFRGVVSLFERVLVSHGAGKVTPAMIVWSNLGWYQMAAAARIRGQCCPANVPAISLPASAPPCDGTHEALDRIVQARSAHADAGDLADTYASSIYCFYANGIPRPYHYRKPPGPSAREQFLIFLEHPSRTQDP